MKRYHVNIDLLNGDHLEFTNVVDVMDGDRYLCVISEQNVVNYYRHERVEKFYTVPYEA